MKKLTLILFVIIVVFMGYKMSNKAPETSIENNNDHVLTRIKEEPKVKDAVITSSNVLYVGVLDDGTRRDGYAEYLCQVLKDVNSDVNRVKVVRFGSHNSPDKDNAYGVLLGESNCF